MHKCEKCGHEAGGFEMAEDKDFEMPAGDDSGVKESALSELMELIESKLGEKLSPKGKPEAMSVEMIAAKPEDDEEEFG